MTTSSSRFLGTLALSAALAITACGSGGGMTTSSSGGSTSGAGEGGGGGSGSPDAITINGKLTPGAGKMVPATGDVLVVWVVGTTTPDTFYGYGAGQSTNSTFALKLDKAPPAMALNSYGLGLGVVVLFPTGKTPADLMVTKDGVSGGIGMAERYAIIYKVEGAVKPSWIGDFPSGYSCGKGVPAQPGNVFETFAPVDCSEVSITVDDLANLKFVNWS